MITAGGGVEGNSREMSVSIKIGIDVAASGSHIKGLHKECHHTVVGQRGAVLVSSLEAFDTVLNILLVQVATAVKAFALDDKPISAFVIFDYYLFTIYFSEKQL